MRRDRIIYGLLTFLMGVSLIACRDRSPEELASTIAASAELTHIDQICTELAKPSTFRQIKKGISGNSAKTIIYYQYVSEMSFTAVRDFYRGQAIGKEYELVNEDFREPEGFISILTIRRNDIRIVLEHRPPSGIFSIDCIKP